MVPSIYNFWSISRRESLESQQKRALRKKVLWLLLCSNDNFNPGYNRRVLKRKRTSILDGVCLNYEQLFHLVQGTACRIYQCGSIEELVWPEVTGILSFSDNFFILEVQNGFENSEGQNSTFLYQSWSLHILFFYHYILSILGKIWSCKYNMTKSQFWFQFEKTFSTISNVPTHSDSKRNQKWEKEINWKYFFRTLQMGWLILILSSAEFITSNR